MSFFLSPLATVSHSHSRLLVLLVAMVGRLPVTAFGFVGRGRYGDHQSGHEATARAKAKKRTSGRSGPRKSSFEKLKSCYVNIKYLFANTFMLVSPDRDAVRGNLSAVEIA